MYTLLMNKFFLKVRDMQLIFVQDNGGQVTGVEVRFWGRRFDAKKIK